MVQEIDLKQWFVVTVAGGSRYVGRIRDEERAELVKDAIRTSSPVAFDLAFDFQLVMVQQGGGAARIPLISPLDLTAAPVPIVVVPVAGYLCGELDEIDQRQYREIIAQGFKALETARARRSGLSL